MNAEVKTFNLARKIPEAANNFETTLKFAIFNQA